MAVTTSELNVLRTLIESDKNRKQTAFMLYYFWQRDIEQIKEYLTTYATKDEMFSASSAKLLPKVHRDIVNKLLNNLCTVYHLGVDRYMANKEGEVDEEQTDLLNEIYKNAGVTQAQKDWYRSGKLFNCVEVKVCWRNGKLDFDLWTPNFFSVWENPANKYLKDLILFDLTLVDDNGQEREVFDVWSDKEHFYMVETESKTIMINGKEEQISVYLRESLPDNPDDVNQYGIIPSCVLRFKKGEDYFGIGMVDVVENNIWHDIELSNQKFVKNFQGLGVLFAVNMGKAGTIALKPNTVLAVNDIKAENETPFIESIATNAPITELDASLKQDVENIMLMNGLSGQAATVDNTNAPGISKAFDAEELDMLRLDDRDILRDFEERLFQVVKTVWNYWNPNNQLKDEFTFICDFIDKPSPLSVGEQINKWRFELDEGLKSKVDYIIEENPDLTIEQAEAILTETKRLKEKYDTKEEEEVIVNG